MLQKKWAALGGIVVLLAGLLMPSPARAQGVSPLVGTWRYDSFSVKYVDGHTPEGGSPDPYGAGATGYLIVDPTGHFMMGIIGARPKFAEQNRRDGTPAELAAVVKATELIFGTYTIDATKSVMIAHIERAMFPNWDGGDRNWQFAIDGDTLHQIFPVTPSAAGPYVPSAIWKRVN
jgi:hypothetical protein